jgi:uncharacterized coiled-coil protein SlyX
MFTRTRLAAVIVAMVALAAVPAVASAKTMPMRGVVSGSPYGASGGQMAIPVLFSKVTARNTGLKSPVGVIIVKRTQRIALPGGGTALPVNLRTGDRFKGTGVIGSLQQRVLYPRVVFPSAQVYFRSKELSLAELSAAVDSLRKSFSDLQAQLNALQAGSIKTFQDLFAQLASLRDALNALKVPAAGVDLTSIQSQIDALTKKLNDLIASLPDFSKFALLSQIPDVSGFLDHAQVEALINAALAGLNIPSTTTIQNLINQTITNLDLPGTYATLTALADANAKITALQGKLTQLCSALNVPVLTGLGINLSAVCGP